MRWLLNRDRRDRLRFVASESPLVAELLTRSGFAAPDAKVTSHTLVVVCDPGRPAEQLLFRSDATIALLRELPGPWRAVGTVLGWIPRPLRDLGYRLVARWRYRIWGRLESCPLPADANREKFL